MKLDISLLFNRVALSLLMLTHGYPKLIRLFSENPTFSNPIGIGEFPTLVLAVFSEFIAPIFIIIGYKTKMFSFFPLVTMLVAGFIVHFDDPLKSKEKALLYLIGFILIFLLGPGKYSIDKK